MYVQVPPHLLLPSFPLSSPPPTSHLQPLPPTAMRGQTSSATEKKKSQSEAILCPATFVLSVLPSLPHGSIGCPTYHDGCQDRVTARLSAHPSTPRLSTFTSIFVAVHGLTVTQQGVGDCQWQPDDSIKPLGPDTITRIWTKDRTWTMHASGLRHDPPAPLSVSMRTDTRQTISLRPVLSHPAPPAVQLSSSCPCCSWLAMEETGWLD